MNFSHVVYKHGFRSETGVTDCAFKCHLLTVLLLDMFIYFNLVFWFITAERARKCIGSIFAIAA